MNRRSFLTRGAAAATGMAATALQPGQRAGPTCAPGAGRLRPGSDEVRALFPRLNEEVYLNAAGGTPLGSFVEAGLDEYRAFVRLGPGEGRGERVSEAMDRVVAGFAGMIAAQPGEIALVHCTKRGEQIVLDHLSGLPDGGILTNDFHFAGSLHNLEGLRRSGRRVDVVRGGADWDVTAEEMIARIDDRTRLVTLTLVSNVNGRVEPIRAIADAAHAYGAVVFADIIQAAGIVDLDMRQSGIDFAACSAYKWLYGLHGTGFLFVRAEHQGTVLADAQYPGHIRFNYAPWVPHPDLKKPAVAYRPPADATRYQPGHISYLGYCGLAAALRFLGRFEPGAGHAHAVSLNRRLVEQLDRDRYPVRTPDLTATPICALGCNDVDRLRERLADAGIRVGLGPGYLRVSPGLYNQERDVDRLAAVLNE